jgi:hypothetical protein
MISIVIIGKRWFWKNLVSKTKYFVYTDDKLWEDGLFKFDPKYFVTREEALDKLNVAIDDIFTNIKFNNIVSYKETYI